MLCINKALKLKDACFGGWIVFAAFEPVDLSLDRGERVLADTSIGLAIESGSFENYVIHGQFVRQSVIHKFRCAKACVCETYG